MSSETSKLFTNQFVGTDSEVILSLTSSFNFWYKSLLTLHSSQLNLQPTAYVCHFKRQSLTFCTCETLKLEIALLTFRYLFVRSHLKDFKDQRPYFAGLAYC